MAAAIPIGAALLGGLAGKAVSKLIGGGKKEAQPQAPPQAPTVMPLPDDARVQQARKRAVVRRLSARGRDSTILTDKLGG